MSKRRGAKSSIVGSRHGTGRARRGLFGLLCICVLALGALLGSGASAAAAAECPNEAIREEQSSTFLPECRAYEQVSPAEKGPGDYVGFFAFVSQQVFSMFAPDGQSALYPLTFGLPDSTTGGSLRYVASRTSTGWGSVQATPADIAPPRNEGSFSLGGKYVYVSPDLSCRFLGSRDALSADAPTDVLEAGGFDLYRQNADGSYTVVNPAPSNPDLHEQQVRGYYDVAGASDDCEHVVFQSNYTYPGVAATGVYEWDDGTLKNVAVRPDGSIPTDANVGAPSAFGWKGDNYRAVSSDGSRVFFSATSNEGGDSGRMALFVRKDAGTTVDVSQSQTAVPDQGAAYQIASRDGSKVFFLANYGLASDSSSGPTTANCASLNPPQACDLYEYDVDSGALTDLSADDNAADTNGATVAGVLGASDDGSYVYFAAQGQLVAAKGNTYAQNQAQETYNVYLAHGGDLSLAGVITQSEANGNSLDLSALLNNSKGVIGHWASQVTPDGRHLLFPSSADVTGYDSGGVAEAYLYSAGSDATVCVSCRPDGQPSVYHPSGISLLLPTGVVWGNTSEQIPRAVSDDGSRVFFTTTDALAPGAISGQPNVYEWENGTVHLLHTEDESKLFFGQRVGFVGASASGDDVFVLSAQRLAPQDTDSQIDLYDMRVGGGFPLGSAPPTCDPLWGACQGSPGTPPAPGAFGSEGVVGNDNASPSRKHAHRGRGFVLGKVSPRARRQLVRRGRGSVVVRVRGGGRVRLQATAKVRGHRRVIAKAARTVRHKRATTVRLSVALSRAARLELARRGLLRVQLVARLSGVRGVKRRTVVLRRPGSTAKAQSRRVRSVRHLMSADHNRTVHSNRGGAK